MEMQMKVRSLPAGLLTKMFTSPRDFSLSGQRDVSERVPGPVFAREADKLSNNDNSNGE